MSKQNKTLKSSFSNRFLDDYLGGKITHDPITAVVELIANAWDAGARNVKINWPIDEGDEFSIIDDGHGLTKIEFSQRWTQLSYNRVNNQGKMVEIPDDNNIHNSRTAYGRNGKGRFSAFCFNDDGYLVETKKDQSHLCYRVKKTTGQNPLLFEEVAIPKPSNLFHSNHGLAVVVNTSKHVGIPENRIRSEIGLRFLTDPDFIVSVNNKPVVFDDLDTNQIRTLLFDFKGVEIKILAIQTPKSDKNTHQHGVAWHVNNRLVGKCSWEGFRGDSIIDGRTSIAKKYSFIVQANPMSEYVKPDWSAFNQQSEVLEFYDIAKSTILSFIIEQTKEKREKTTKRLKENNRLPLSKVNPIGVNRWSEFIESIQVECPSLMEEELDSIAKILANLEESTSQYNLIHKLSECSPKDMDDLYEILKDWNISSAKNVLDEIQTRLYLVEELRNKVHKKDTLEVQELQPLFGKGLWIFGTEFESIEYTSNQGMTKVLNELFKLDTKGSRNRPDFVVLPESTVGLYGCYDYDESGYETGVKKVVIIELKKPGVDLGSKEKEQCWRYVKELYNKGAILPNAKVDCYLLGESIERGESYQRDERDRTVRILPMTFDTILKRAETRLLNLHKKIQNAPFLEEFDINQYLEINKVTSYEQPFINIPTKN